MSTNLNFFSDYESNVFCIFVFYQTLACPLFGSKSRIICRRICRIANNSRVFELLIVAQLLEKFPTRVVPENSLSYYHESQQLP